MKLTLLKEWLCLSVAAYVVYALLWSAVYVGHNAWSIDAGGIFIDLGYCAMFTLSSLLLEHFLLRGRHRKSITRNVLIINGFLTICLNLIIAVLYETFLAELIYKPETEDFWGSLYIFCIVASFVAEFHVIREYAEIVIKQKDENIILTKKLLKSQMDPHFVFNSLNILSGLIKENPDRAERFTISLSKVYRHIISNFDKDLVSINEAVSFAKEYVSIMQVRFPDSIQLEIGKFEKRADENILSMCIQLLIENAIKHNYPTPEHKLAISISKTKDQLIVRNSINNLGCSISRDSSSGLGLKNLEQRYLIECGLKPQIRLVKDNNKDYFEVSIPIIKQI